MADGTPFVEILFASTLYIARLLNCHDGDSCTIHFENAPAIIATQTIRLHGIDTPEMRSSCAAAKQLAQQAKAVTQADLPKETLLYTGEKDRYGRLLMQAKRLNEKLISQGLARPYDGGKRQPWC